MGVTERSTVTGVRKEGSGSLDPASLEDMMQVSILYPLPCHLNVSVGNIFPIQGCLITSIPPPLTKPWLIEI